MTNQPVFTIGELADMAETTPRTIRYYTAEGLLPPPDTRGRYALYTEEHLRRLQLIARLKEAYLPLGEIKARLEQLSAEQVGQLLAEYAQPASQPGSAADYIAQVLTGAAAPRMLAESTPGYAAQAGEPASAKAPESAASLPIGFAIPPAAAQAPVPPPAPPAPAPQRAGVFRRLVAPRRDTAPDVQAGPAETWRRVTLAPGVELNMREPLPAQLQAQVERLLERAHELFEGRPGGERQAD